MSKRDELASNDRDERRGRELGSNETRVARSFAALDRLLSEVESGRKAKPDWVNLQGDCRLDRLPANERERIVQRLHPSVLRGFRARNVNLEAGSERLAFWRSIARNGFHDFSEQGWMKDYDSPFIESYDYIGSYLSGGIDALDPYRIYSSVLGSHDYTVEDFVDTELCRDVSTVVEPMAGTAEFAYQGHFRFPDFHFIMSDLDPDAHDHVLARPWLENTERHYIVANVLEHDVWERTKSLASGPSLAFIGKQSHHLFGAKQLMQLLDVATQHVDFFMLEASEISLVFDLPSLDELTRPEMEDAGLHVALIDEPEGSANPFTTEMHFRLEAWDDDRNRVLFHYPRWTTWHPPTLVAFAELLDLEVYYLHSELEEFVAVSESAAESDCHENATFMVFTRRTA